MKVVREKQIQSKSFDKEISEPVIFTISKKGVSFFAKLALLYLAIIGDVLDWADLSGIGAVFGFVADLIINSGSFLIGCLAGINQDKKKLITQMISWGVDLVPFLGVFPTRVVATLIVILSKEKS